MASTAPTHMECDWFSVWELLIGNSSISSSANRSSPQMLSEPVLFTHHAVFFYTTKIM